MRRSLGGPPHGAGDVLRDGLDVRGVDDGQVVALDGDDLEGLTQGRPSEVGVLPEVARVQSGGELLRLLGTVEDYVALLGTGTYRSPTRASTYEVRWCSMIPGLMSRPASATRRMITSIC